MRKRLIKYKPPVDSKNMPYFVPVVVKSKDYLTGFLDGIFTVISCGASDMHQSTLFSSLGSDRFNDILPDGRRVSELHKKEFEKYVISLLLKEKEIDNMSKNNKEFDLDIFEEYYLTIECQCGNFYGFYDAKDIPNKNLHCSVCDKVLIHYTNHDDSYYTFDGDPGDVEGIVKQFNSVDTEEDEDD